MSFLSKDLKRPPRKALWIGIGVIIAVAAALGYWYHITHPPKPWLVRSRVQRFLKKESLAGNFKVDFPFPSRAEMATAPRKARDESEDNSKGKRTGKQFDDLRKEYIDLKLAVLGLERKARGDGTELNAKREALDPITADLWDIQRAWIAEQAAVDSTSATRLARARDRFADDLQQELATAGSYGEIYRLIGQKLWVADRLLSSANPEHRRIGLTLALQASQNALDDAQNGWLAGRICEGYIWPHLDVADDTNRRSPFNIENLLNECANILRRCGEWQSVARNYRQLLERADTPKRADWARAQMAMALEQAGQPKQALHYLREIQATNDFAWALRRVPRLQRQIQAN